MEYAYSIIMFAMGAGLLLYAGCTALIKKVVLPMRYRNSVKVRDKKLYAKQFAKGIAIIAAAFIVSGLVGLTQIYVLAVILLIVGFVGGTVATVKLTECARE